MTSASSQPNQPPATVADRVRDRRAARDASGAMYVDGSIYQGMAACLARSGRTVAHVVDYGDAVEIVEAVAAAAKPAATFQQRVQPWLLACFGEMIAGDREERNHRFLEEGLELVQAAGCTASEAHQLVDYVFGRPVGEPAQEVGGVMVTLAALCLANDLDMHSAAEAELERVWTKVEAIRAKQAAKPKHSPLPAHDRFPWPVRMKEAIQSAVAMLREPGNWIQGPDFCGDIVVDSRLLIATQLEEAIDGTYADADEEVRFDREGPR